MFQSLRRRTRADDQHLCVTCQSKNNCEVKPLETNWSMVLEYCMRYKEEDEDSEV